MKPFQNESDAVFIGDLLIENRFDRITISGEADLLVSQAGLNRARALQVVFADVVRALEQKLGEEGGDDEPPQIDEVPNPFKELR